MGYIGVGVGVGVYDGDIYGKNAWVGILVGRLYIGYGHKVINGTLH